MSQWHGGKGSAPRPKNVPKEVWESNWDRIFGKKDIDRLDGFWYHNCKHDGEMHVAKGQTCNWCGMKEDGTFD